MAVLPACERQLHLLTKLCMIATVQAVSFHPLVTSCSLLFRGYLAEVEILNCTSNKQVSIFIFCISKFLTILEVSNKHCRSRTYSWLREFT